MLSRTRYIIYCNLTSSTTVDCHHQTKSLDSVSPSYIPYCALVIIDQHDLLVEIEPRPMLVPREWC